MYRLLSASTALAMTVACLDVPLAEAHGGGGGGGGHFASFSTHVQSTRSVSHVQTRLTARREAHVTHHQHSTHHSAHHSDKLAHVRAHVRDGKVKLDKMHLAKLPSHPALTGTMLTKGRLEVPHNLKPKFTLTKLSGPMFQKKMGPFVQKYWKKPYFWVALAGIGYVTVPELYYDRFLGCIEDEDYDRCVSLMSYAAVEEEDAAARVHHPMPPTASYRYTATLSPQQAAGGAENGAAPASGRVCTFAPFVERKWNTAFVWVRIPDTGNVTVPEDYYDRFQGAVATSPPNYQAACGVLVEAAAADMMVTAGVAPSQRDGQIN
jgi:hypothetical protein